MTSIEPESNGRQNECAICGERDVLIKLIDACNCSGTMKYVHYECLSDWIDYRSTKWCSICRTEYKKVKILEERPSFWEYCSEMRSGFISSHLFLYSFPIYLSFVAIIHNIIVERMGYLWTAVIHHIVFLLIVFLSIIWLYLIRDHWFTLYGDYKLWSQYRIKYRAIPLKT